MSLKADIYRQINRIYDSMRNDSEADLRRRREEIYNKVPRIKEIENEMSMIGVKAARAVINKPQNTAEVMADMKNESERLMSEKAFLLTDNGYPHDYLELKYKCSKCKDTGYFEGKRCSCFNKLFVEMAYGMSNMKKMLETENFDYFDFNFYSCEVVEDDEKSPRENMQFIFDKCLKFVRTFGEGSQEGIFLYGPTGLGKTFVCNCIAKDILDKGYTVIYMTSPQLFKILADEQFRNDSDEQYKGAYNDILDVDLLIIDDLGTEMTNMFTASQLFNIINSRILSKKPCIISTNMDYDDMAERYSDRVVSRIVGYYDVFRFYGDDIRLSKKFG